MVKTTIVVNWVWSLKSVLSHKLLTISNTSDKSMKSGKISKIKFSCVLSVSSDQIVFQERQHICKISQINFS